MTGNRNGNGRVVVAPRAELACREVVELVTDYMEAAMPAMQRRRFEAHLLACEGCAGYLAQMRGTVVALGTLSGEDVAAERRERLVAEFPGWHES